MILVDTELYAQIDFPKHRARVESGDLLTITPQQYSWYAPDGRIALTVPVPSGGVSGLVFLDDNADTINDPGEGFFSLPFSMKITDVDTVEHIVPINVLNGTYTLTGLPVGNASVEPDETTLPAGYEVSNESYPFIIPVVADTTAAVPDFGLAVAGGGA